MPEKTAAQKKAQKAYMQKFARVELRMTLQNRESVQAHAAARGESVNAFINRAIRNQIERDNEGCEE
jgi:predicted DNA binding CopG/RHH family protein